MPIHPRGLAHLFAAAALAVFALAACNESSAGPSDAPDAAGSFGCCPDYKPGCTLFRNGPKRSANDNCIDGYDGTVPDPGQSGWSQSVDAYGCGVWTPPPKPTYTVCGLVRPQEPRVDAGDASAEASDASASDANADSAADAATD